MNFKKFLALMFASVFCFSFVACNNSDTGKPKTEPDGENGNTDDGESTDSGTESETEPKKPIITDKFPLNILMRPIFMNETTTGETVMFLDKGDVRTLLYPIESILSVTSYDGLTVYKEGVDYEVVNGNIKVLSGSSIPCITSSKYYNHNGSRVVVDGKSLYEGEGKMQPYQVRVNYTHSADWEGFLQQCQSETYASFIQKLERGEDVTVFFYGDSITCGASASWYMEHEPYQWTYPLLFTQALADLYDYSVRHVAAGLDRTGKVPDNYYGGFRGTITYVNTAVGGWQSDTGKNNVDAYVKEKIEQYGCDLFVIGFGMNDGTARMAASETASNIKFVVDEVLKLKPNANIVILSTMVAHPGSERWDGTQKDQEAALIDLAKEYRDNGVACNVCQMTSTSLAVLTRKDFRDYSANNINHPSDFFVRIYAQTLFQTVIGYDNLDWKND